MPRKYVKKNNPIRAYGTSDPESLKSAVEAVKSWMSYANAAKKFNVKRSTLFDHQKMCKKPGGQQVLSSDIEGTIAEILDSLAEWGYPMCVPDLQSLIKNYLDEGKIITRFKEIMPGRDWVYSFIRRNNLSGRFASYIKRARASMTPEVIGDFFDELEKFFAENEIYPQNIFNFDETNVTDDPGKKWVLVRRRGRRRIESVKDHSKTAISLMWCGSATGELLPL